MIGVGDDMIARAVSRVVALAEGRQAGLPLWVLSLVALVHSDAKKVPHTHCVLL